MRRMVVATTFPIVAGLNARAITHRYSAWPRVNFGCLCGLWVIETDLVYWLNWCPSAAKVGSLNDLNSDHPLQSLNISSLTLHVSSVPMERKSLASEVCQGPSCRERGRLRKVENRKKKFQSLPVKKKTKVIFANHTLSIFTEVHWFLRYKF